MVETNKFPQRTGKIKLAVKEEQMKFSSSSENFLTEDANNRLRKVTAQPLGVICTRGLPILSEIQAGRLAITFASSVEGEESLDISQKPLHCGIPPNIGASAF